MRANFEFRKSGDLEWNLLTLGQLSRYLRECLFSNGEIIRSIAKVNGGDIITEQGYEFRARTARKEQA